MAEWTTLLVSSFVVGAIVVLIAVQMVSAADAAQPVARVVGVSRAGDRFWVRVVVDNEGDETAANVQVSASLSVVGAEAEEGGLSIDFLAGDESQELVFVFDTDPEQGELDVGVTGFEDP